MHPEHRLKILRASRCPCAPHTETTYLNVVSLCFRRNLFARSLLMKHRTAELSRPLIDEFNLQSLVVFGSNLGRRLHRKNRTRGTSNNPLGNTSAEQAS